MNEITMPPERVERLASLACGCAESDAICYCSEVRELAQEVRRLRDILDNPQDCVMHWLGIAYDRRERAAVLAERDRCKDLAILVAEVEEMSGGGARSNSAARGDVARRVAEVIANEQEAGKERDAHACRAAVVGPDALAAIRSHRAPNP